MAETTKAIELRTSIESHMREIRQQRAERSSMQDEYLLGHFDGLLSGLGFALDYVNEAFPPEPKPFDFLDIRSA